MLCPNPDCPDIELFGIQGQYKDGIVNCPKCGAQLIPDRSASDDLFCPEEGDEQPVNSELAEAPIHAAGPNDWLVPIISLDYRHEAEVVKTFLDAHGIPSDVTSDDCFALNPALCLTNEARVRVRTSDLEDADNLLDGVDDGLFLIESTAEDSPGIDAAAQALLLKTHAWAQRLFIAGLLLLSSVLLPLAFFVSLRGLQTVPRNASPSMRILYRRFFVLTFVSGFYAFVTLSSAVLGILVMWEIG